MKNLIIVEVTKGLFVRMTKEEADRFGYSEINIKNKVAKPARKKTVSKTKVVEEE